MTNHVNKNQGALFRDNHGDIHFHGEPSRESELRRILDVMLDSPIYDIDELDTSEYEISNKIEHNKVNGQWLEIIYDYPAYEDAINNALKENNDGIPQKPKFLMQIRSYYRRAKTDLDIPINCQESIKKYSSDILNKVKDYYLEFLKEQNELREHYDEMNVEVLIAYGFVECKVLEKPNK